MEKEIYKMGDFLYELPLYDDDDWIYSPENQRVFIYNGFKNGDGYGVLLGWYEGKIVSSTGTKNFCWGGKVRKATQSEISEFMQAIMNQDVIKKY